jgi:hypothetical protein
MNSAARFLICFSAGIVLCQCTGPKEKKVDPTEQTLEKRTTSGMDLTKRSRYEKSISDSKLTGNNAGSYFQKQTHHSKSFIGADSYAGQKQFKTNQSIFGKSKAKGLDMTYALGNKHAGGAKTASRQRRPASTASRPVKVNPCSAEATTLSKLAPRSHAARASANRRISSRTTMTEAAAKKALIPKTRCAS